MNRAEDILDEEDWIELEKVAKSGPTLAEVSVRVTVAAIGRHNPKPKARAYLAFRGKAAEWIVEHGPRFRVAIGGPKANAIRIVPDIEKGKFEFGDAIGGKTKRMNLGVITAWPSEERASTDAQWSVSYGYMMLRLPDNFAVSRPVERKETAPSARPTPVAPPRSSNIVTMPGDAPPGRLVARGRG